MLCDICKSSEATIKIKKITDGSVTELNICEDCARRHLFDASGFDISFLISQIMNMIGYDPKHIAQDKTCPSCGTSFSDFIKTGKLGCAYCYQNFEDLLAPILDKIGRGDSGKQEDGANNTAGENILNIKIPNENTIKLNELKSKLETALENEEYETACVLRDEINRITAESEE